MIRLTAWYRDAKSRGFLQISLLFSALFWLSRTVIIIPFHYWPWIVVSLAIGLICVIQIYRLSRALIPGELRSFLFLLLITNSFPSFLIEDCESKHYFILLPQAFCYSGILWTVFSRISGKQIYIPRNLRSPSPSVTIPQLCFVMMIFCFSFAYLINKDNQPSQFPPHIDTDKWSYTLIFLIPGGFFALWVSTYYLQAFYFWLSDYMAARRKID